MAKYIKSKQRIIDYMKETGIEAMTSHEMLDVLSTTKSGRPSSMVPQMNRFCQSLARDKRFVKLGMDGKNKRNSIEGGYYNVMVWGLGVSA